MPTDPRICIFGGTFDPIHAAHLRIAEEARQAFSLTRVLFVPAGNPPHKESTGLAPYEDRYTDGGNRLPALPGVRSVALGRRHKKRSYTVIPSGAFAAR